MIKAVLFDKDGTILRFSNIYTDSLIEYLEDKNLDTIIKKKLFQDIGVGEDRKAQENSILASETIGDVAVVLSKYLDMDANSLFIEIDDYIYNYYKNNKDRIETTCDVIDIFKKLKEKGILIGIFTSDNYRQTKFAMDFLGFTEYIDFIATADTYKKKPDTEALEVFKEKYNLKDEEIIVIGDSKVDMLFGNGTKKLGVTCGTGSREMLEEYADHIIENPSEVFKYI
ncbi:HAD family hydrolase [Peptoniphilus sp. MSJ-1]|uniref:HAD family hydrolase n=1 Tax=Peptoniphilus ovalis TaxID=2841503 RepID=A0ABS6FEJ2_9FIRM|nr:HAD family hydrolase [Peptoniphilus ovalis]MBU5668604.1 HAD family hydrolase [Peptoniphilus ovalis]